MAVPVLELTYQDRLEGLFNQFRLPPKLLLKSAKLSQSNDWYRTLAHFLQRLPKLRATMKEHLPKVAQLAGQTFNDIW